MTELRQGGALLSPPDARDYRVGACMEVAGTDIPPDYAVWQPPVENQGSTGNCVAQALANILECIDHHKQKAHRDCSVGFIYGQRATPSTGMYPRDACSILTDTGDVYRDEFECLEERPEVYTRTQAELARLLPLAAKHKVQAYVRLTTKEEVQRFILKYQLPVMIVSEAINVGGWGNSLHALACYGWQDTRTCANEYHRRDGRDMLYTNSWGTGGAFGDGKGAVRFDKLLEIWGIVPMARKELTDIKGHWAEPYINELVDAGIVDGYEDNTFKPEGYIARGETAKLMALLLERIEQLETKVATLGGK